MYILGITSYNILKHFCSEICLPINSYSQATIYKTD